jgi:hypothetical protein
MFGTFDIPTPGPGEGIECGSKHNSLPKCGDKEFIFTETHLLTLFSKKLRRLKHGLRSQGPCSKYEQF